MSAEHQTHQSKEEQGTTKSYVIGFILSLILTFIPYWLVTNQVLSSGLLLKMIIGIAMVQMLIQILFFLHLGRGPKPLYNVTFFVFTVGLIVVVIGGSIFIMRHLHNYQAPTELSKKLIEDEGIYQVGGEKTGACRGVNANYKVTIKDGTVSPLHTQARQCDTLTFINQDDAEHSIAFGSPASDVGYAGQNNLSVRKGRNKTITLSQAGKYQFHDALDLDVIGDFSVAQ